MIYSAIALSENRLIIYDYQYGFELPNENIMVQYCKII